MKVLCYFFHHRNEPRAEEETDACVPIDEVVRRAEALMGDCVLTIVEVLGTDLRRHDRDALIPQGTDSATSYADLLGGDRSTLIPQGADAAPFYDDYRLIRSKVLRLRATLLGRCKEQSDYDIGLDDQWIPAPIGRPPGHRLALLGNAEDGVPVEYRYEGKPRSAPEGFDGPRYCGKIDMWSVDGKGRPRNPDWDGPFIWQVDAAEEAGVVASTLYKRTQREPGDREYLRSWTFGNRRFYYRKDIQRIASQLDPAKECEQLKKELSDTERRLERLQLWQKKRP